MMVERFSINFPMLRLDNDDTGPLVRFFDYATLSARVAQLEEALRLADEWMCCVEPHLRDTAGFKREREAIRSALAEKEARG